MPYYFLYSHVSIKLNILKKKEHAQTFYKMYLRNVVPGRWRHTQKIKMKNAGKILSDLFNFDILIFCCFRDSLNME